MKTVTIQIGNSDDKLSQELWCDFITDTADEIKDIVTLHFSGGSEPRVPWQNYTFVGVIEEGRMAELKSILGELCRFFNQDSIALSVGETIFVSIPAPNKQMHGTGEARPTAQG